MDFVNASKVQKPPQTFPWLLEPSTLGKWRALPKNTQAASWFYSQPKYTSPLQSCNKSKWILCSKVKGMSQTRGNNQALEPPPDLTPVLCWPQGQSTAKI